jgi:hypothetical protein
MTLQEMNELHQRVRQRYEHARLTLIAHKEKFRGWMVAMDGLVTFWRMDHPLNLEPGLWERIPDRAEFANAVEEFKRAAHEYEDARTDAARVGFAVDGDVEEIVKGKSKP